MIHESQLLIDLKTKESYSTLAAQVAHDIRSPLTALDAALNALVVEVVDLALDAQDGDVGAAAEDRAGVGSGGGTSGGGGGRSGR